LRIASGGALLQTRGLSSPTELSMSTQTLNTQALQAYLKEHLPGFSGTLTAEKFPGGQSNPTFLLSDGNSQWVLRRKPPGELLASAHAVDREYRVLSALADTDVPVARTWLLCEDESVIGSMFYVMEYLDGRVFWDPKLPEIDSPQERAAMYDEMNRVLAALHSVDPTALGLADFGRPGSYFERQVSRWTKQYRASETERSEAMETLIAWLPANMPDDDGQVSLVHGDYRLDNLMFHASEPRIIGVLDWELSTLGHPLADLSYQVMAWQLPDNDGVRGLMGVDRGALGLPTDEAYVARYCERTGRESISHWNFYLAFCFFRLAAILQGVKKRALIGTASSAEAEARGALVEPLAQLGLQYIDS
jgi:aminoglycoside phosphotransferase (APT) family kinase protein